MAKKRVKANKRAKPGARKTPRRRPSTPCIALKDIKIGARHRKNMGDIEGLARSIDARGALLQPIVIEARTNKLIAGQRRLKAWPLTRFAQQPIPCHFVDIDAIVAGEWDENAERKDFTPPECVAIKRALEPIARKLAAQQAAARPKGSKPAPGRKGNPDDRVGRVNDNLARYLGKGRTTIERAEAVVKAAEAAPKNPKLQELVDYMEKTGKVNGPFKRLQNMRQHEAITNNPPVLPDGLFDRIVADLPWPHEPDDAAPAASGRATRPYPPMSIEEMCELDVAGRTAKNCVCYFWVTGFHMQFAYLVLRRWGFTMIKDAQKTIPDQIKNFVRAPTILTWVKDKNGRGQRLLDKAEFCIIAIKGKPAWNLTNQTTVLHGPVREHSQKPDQFYELIDQISPAARSLEICARRELPAGWDGFGDQVGKIKNAPTAAAREKKIPRVRRDLATAGEKQSPKKDPLEKKPRQIDIEELIEHAASGVDCRVCSDGSGICAECVVAADHAVTMTNPNGLSTCACGWKNEVPWEASRSEQDAAIKDHWQRVVEASKEAAPA